VEGENEKPFEADVRSYYTEPLATTVNTIGYQSVFPNSMWMQ